MEMEIEGCDIKKGKKYELRWSSNLFITMYIIDFRRSLSSPVYKIKTYDNKNMEWRMHLTSGNVRVPARVVRRQVIAQPREPPLAQLQAVEEPRVVPFSVGVNLDLISADYEPNTSVTVNASLRYYDTNGHVLIESHSKIKTLTYPTDASIKFPNFFRRDINYFEDHDYIQYPSQDPKILCKLTVIEKPQPPQSDGVMTLLDNFSKLLDSRMHSDVVFAVGEKELPAHKAVLAARSPVFAAMFDHDLTENTKNRVDIVDIMYGVFRELLRYIYTGSVENMKEMAFSLYVAADKYALVELKLMCAKSLQEGLTVHNAMKALAFADLYDDEGLKSKVLSFVADNIFEVMTTPEFEEEMTSNPKSVALWLKELKR